MSDMSGGSKKIVIDNAKYHETLKPNSIELFIFDVKTSDIGFYIYHATDGLNFAKNTPLTLAITGLLQFFIIFVNFKYNNEDFILSLSQLSSHHYLSAGFIIVFHSFILSIKIIRWSMNANNFHQSSN